MGTVATAGQDFKRELPPAGAHIARCFMVVDLGTQNSSYMGKPKKAHKILIAWELPNELITEGDFAGKPFALYSRYTLSLFDQALLRQHLESWRGRAFTEPELAGFDVKNVLGAYCMVSVVHNTEGDKTYANVKGVMPLPKGTPKPAPVNEAVYFDVDTSDLSVIPEWIQNVVKKSDEWIMRSSQQHPEKPKGPGGGVAEMDDDIPFANPYRGRLSYVV